MSESKPAIRVEALHKQFRIGHLIGRRFTALQGVSLEVLPGRTFGFLGPNGAGKTTTIKIIAGLIFPNSGTVEILGEPAHSTSVRKRYGYLPENPSFHDHLTGSEVLEFFGQLLGMNGKARQRRKAEVLELVKLTAAADVPVRRYSKGMVQRLGIAQSLLHDPELVILDEPMSGLDPIGRRDMKDLIRNLRDQKRTVFFSTHIIADVEEICDDVAILIGGKIVRQGKVSEFLLSEAREVELVATGVPQGFPNAGPPSPSGVTRFKFENEQQAREAAIRLWEAGARILSLNIRKYNLEDLFMSEVAKLPAAKRALED